MADVPTGTASTIPTSVRARRWHRVELVIYGLVAALLLTLLTLWTGRITENNGYGYDGKFYVQMMREGMEGGTPSTRLRPLVVSITGLVDRYLLHDAIAAFHATNLLFAAVLAVLLAVICRRYGASRGATAAFIVNVFLCISTAKMFAYYPTLVDLGAYAFMTAGVWAIVTGRRLLIVLTSVLAVLSREFAAVLVLFGLGRDLRERRSWLVAAATYAPVIVAIAWVRRMAASYPDDTAEAAVLSFDSLFKSLIGNVSWWADPLYAAFWVYFAATVFGGTSLWLLTTRAPWKTCFRTEPEWFALIVPLVVVTVLGGLDMWRYMAYALPALPAMWAWSVSGMTRGQLSRVVLGVTAVTLVTQRPWQGMDVEGYFRDWFPYYVVIEDRTTAGDELFPVWSYRFVLAIVSTVVLLLLRRFSRSATGGFPNNEKSLA